MAKSSSKDKAQSGDVDGSATDESVANSIESGDGVLPETEDTDAAAAHTDFRRRLHDVRMRAELHASRHDFRELGLAVRDLCDLILEVS